jgi:lysophospholipid acyltransferase (LPLAT)-like uncharacterized protein
VARIREVIYAGWLQYLALLPLYLFARLWLRTLRLRTSDEMKSWLRDARPILWVMWHNRLFMGAHIYQMYRRSHRLVGLVSASGDGAWLAAYFKLAGIEAVRGSSSWRGIHAARELLNEMEKGADVGITPDGPRGPCYDIKPGALLLARHSKAPLLLMSCNFRSAWRLRSWDGFYLPKPFSIVDVRSRILPNYESLGATDDASAALELRRHLMEISEDLPLEP